MHLDHLQKIKSKKWMTSIEKCVYNDKVIKITNSNDRKLFCSKDMNEADIILTTYEYLIKSPKSLGIRKRLVKKKGSIFFLLLNTAG